jgi:phytoene synthase
MVALAREHLSAFQAGAATLPRSLRPAFLPVALTGAYLDQLEKPGSSPLKKTVQLSALRRHWLLFRRASRGWGG